MKISKALLIGLAGVSLISLGVGCSPRSTAKSSNDAIQQAKQQPTVEAQTDYLLKQADSFLSSKNFDEAIKTAQYILSDLDKESQKAKGILEKAKIELEKTAKESVTQMQGQAEKTVGDLKSKIGSMGQ